MITVDIRGNDPHHFYRVTARDPAQLERIKTYIRHRIAAGDPDLVRGPGIEGARVSTQRRASRSPRPDQPTQPNRTPRPAPHPTAIKQYGSLAWESAKRGPIGTLANAVNAARIWNGQQLTDQIMAAADPRGHAAFRAAYPAVDGDYIRRGAEQFGIIHPETKAHNYLEHLALDAPEFVTGSFIPFFGWAGTASRVAGRAGQIARATNWLERAAIGAARRPLRSAASLGTGAVGSVTLGEVAERNGWPRWSGEAPGAILGGLAPAGLYASANAVREAALVRQALRTIRPEDAYRAIYNSEFRQDPINRLDMGNWLEMEQKLKGDRKLALDGFMMADTVPLLLKRKQTGEEMLSLEKWASDDLRAPRPPLGGGGRWSIPQLVSMALNEWRYRSAVKHFRGSWQDWFLRQHPELAQHLRVVRQAPIKTSLSRNTYLPKSQAQVRFEQTGELLPGSVIPDVTTYPVAHVPLPSRVLYPPTQQAYKAANAEAKSFVKKVRRRLGADDSEIAFHHNDPVVLGGAPADPTNLVPLSNAIHERIVTPWWGPWIRNRQRR